MILLGDGRSGKTSLANRLLNKDLPKEADRTQGVDIVIGEYSFPLASGKNFKINIWDFAGQDKYKTLHQLFYTESSLYVMVGESGNMTTDYDDWFQTAELFGEGSPLILVLNEFKAGIVMGSFDSNYWKKQFPELLKEVFTVNLATKQNFSAAEEHIRLLAQTLPHTKYAFPSNWAGGDMALDGGEEWFFFRVGKSEAARHLPPGTKIENSFGPGKMGAGPAGIAAMHIKTGQIKHVVSVPYQGGHIQTNSRVPGEIVFCWETGGKSPQRTWTVRADGTGFRPLYPELPYEWVTHEAVISKDEVAIAIMGHRKINVNKDSTTANARINPGQDWGPSGTREKPTGPGIVNLRTREMTIAGQTHTGSGLWHVSGSADERWAVGDDFSRNIYLIDRHTREMILLSSGHKVTAADHPSSGHEPRRNKNPDTIHNVIR